MNLTISEIKNLAEFAGMTVDLEGIDADEMESEISVVLCPKDGLLDDDGKTKIKYTGHIAYFSEYPEEGCHPLGEEYV